MAQRKDFINILQEIRGTGQPGDTYTNGIWYELTMADKNGNAGVYGDILAKYGVVVDNTATLDQAVAIIDGLTVVANSLPEGSAPTAELVGTTLTLGVPIGATGAQGVQGPIGPKGNTGAKGDKGDTGPAGADGTDGHTPTEAELNAIVSANVNVQAAQTLVADAIAQAETDIGAVATTKTNEFNTNSANKTNQYNDNHTTKLAEYNANDSEKLSQYNYNATVKVDDFNSAYAARIVDLLNTSRILGMVDKFAAEQPTYYATFLSTDHSSYLYYLNGVKLVETTDYTILNETTIELVNPIAHGDVVTQINTTYVGDYISAEGSLTQDAIGVANGLAGLDANAKLLIENLVATDIKSVYESNANTNEFTDAEKSKLLYVNQDVTDLGTPTFASVQLSGGTADQGKLSWNVEDETLDLTVSGDVTYQLGQELGIVARNLSGAELTNGKVVRVTGASGDKVTISTASNVDELNSANTLAVVTEAIGNNSTGKITTNGLVRGLDTSGIAEGSAIWLGVDGAFTATKPETPAHLVHIGWVVRSHAVEGIIYVRVSNGWELEELHDVLITNITNGELLQWNGSYWENKTATEAGVLPLTGGTISGDLTITGNIIQNGTAYETHAEQVYTTKDEVILRDGAVSALADGVQTGLRAKLYDGVNDGLLVFGNDGVARVGDEGSTQALATREDSPLDNGVAVWNDANSRFESVAKNAVLTKSDVGLGNVDNTADSAKNVASAAKWTTARTISLTGDVTGSVSIDGSTNVSITATVADDSHNHVISNVDGLQTALDSKISKVTSTDNAIVRFDGTNGSVQNSSATIDDSGNIVAGTVNGRDVAADGTTLDNIGTVAEFEAALN